MPPKKRRRVVNPNARPGVARVHLEGNFSALPESLEDLKKGHVLCLFTSLGRSHPNTERRLKAHYSLTDADAGSSPLISRVRSLVRGTLLKFKKLTDPKELESFRSICDEAFRIAKINRKKEGERILIVGLACLDLVTAVDSYPLEDSDSRVANHKWCGGGNAANTSVVLSQLGPLPVECLATLADTPTTKIITENFTRYRVSHKNCVYHKSKDTPMSIVIVNRSNGSRTILHGNRDLPEVMLGDFEKLDLTRYKWIHFEGRNVTEVLKMIARIRSHNQATPDEKKIVVSVELEKGREEYKMLFPAGDVVFVSKEYAAHQGYSSATECLEGNSSCIRQGALLICAWGERGAWGRDEDGQILSSPPFKPPTVLETLAAGDTFNAGVISTLSAGKSLQESLTFGCRVAGYKCGVEGLDIDGFVST